jgi:FlaG/FlaF family flagellin (archaellin)
VKYITIIALLIAVLVIGGCNASSQPVPQKQKETATTTPTTQEKPKTNFAIGDMVRFKDNQTIVAYSYLPEVNSSNQFLQPKPGNKYVAVDVEGCAASNASTATQLNMFSFELVMSNNTRISPTVSIIEPGLNSVDLLPGDCGRGYVTFEIPKDQKPSSLTFKPLAANQQPVKWTL